MPRTLYNFAAALPQNNRTAGRIEPDCPNSIFARSRDMMELDSLRTAAETEAARCLGNLGLFTPPGSKGLHKWNFLAKMNEEILNEDKQIH
jgi:hypothetical protein